VHAYSDWNYYMVTSPFDWIQTVWILIFEDPAGSGSYQILKKTSDIRPERQCTSSSNGWISIIW